MDERTKNIIEDFDKREIGLEAPFMFHCTMCGECCINREDILLNAFDVFRMSKTLNTTPEEFCKRYCDIYPGPESRLVVVRLNPVGDLKICPLLQGTKCMVHEAKPTVCALFPLGRGIINQQGDDPDKVEGTDIKYIFTDPGCGDKAEIHTVREWLSSFGIPVDDPFFVKWQKITVKLSQFLREAEKTLDEKKMFKLWDCVYIYLYLKYDMERDFSEQFEENTQMLTMIMEVVKGEDDAA